MYIIILIHKIAVMKLKKMIMIAGLGSLVYYLFKKRSPGTEKNKRGTLGGFVKEAVEDIKKPLDEIGADIDKVPDSRPAY
jgi:hypothetical protein